VTKSYCHEYFIKHYPGLHDDYSIAYPDSKNEWPTGGPPVAVSVGHWWQPLVANRWIWKSIPDGRSPGVNEGLHCGLTGFKPASHRRLPCPPRAPHLPPETHRWLLSGCWPGVSPDAGGMAEWRYWPTGISGCRWHDRMKPLTHWYLRMQVWHNEATYPLVSQDAGGTIEWSYLTIGISGCRWLDRMKLLTHLS
jgi:hypothetical protein